MKAPVVSISSSSDDDDDDDYDERNVGDEEELESEFSSADDSDDSESDDQEYDVDEENDVESDEEECFDNRDELCDRVVSFHQGSNDLQELSLNECKAYLRKHGLRLSGTKDECIMRIKDHGRLKDGRGESFYPRSSFSINCTGDACKGDAVLFKQKVYKKFDKVARGDVVGKRTVAGRIVKESYGASNQQHTFTIEVFWSKGPKKLSPLSTLLVKGRNLYRFRTFRQPWKSEAERSKVLGEKHKRGAAARHKRKLKITEIASKKDKSMIGEEHKQGAAARHKRKLKITEIASKKDKGMIGEEHKQGAAARHKRKLKKTDIASKKDKRMIGEKHKQGAAARHKRKLKKTEIASKKDKGTKRQKLSHKGPSRSQQPPRTDKQKSAKKRGAAPVNTTTTGHKRKPVWFQKTESKTSQPTFRAEDPNRSMNSSSSLPYDQTASFPNLPPVGHYNHGQPPLPNHVLFCPPVYYHYNHEQPVPWLWYWFG